MSALTGLIVSSNAVATASTDALSSLPSGVSAIRLRAEIADDIDPPRIREYCRRPLIYQLGYCADGGSDEARRQRLREAARLFDFIELDAERDLVPHLLTVIAASRRVISWHGAACDAASLGRFWPPARFPLPLCASATRGHLFDRAVAVLTFWGRHDLCFLRRESGRLLTACGAAPGASGSRRCDEPTARVRFRRDRRDRRLLPARPVRARADHRVLWDRRTFCAAFAVAAAAQCPIPGRRTRGDVRADRGARARRRMRQPDSARFARPPEPQPARTDGHGALQGSRARPGAFAQHAGGDCRLGQSAAPPRRRLARRNDGSARRIGCALGPPRRCGGSPQR